MTNYQIPSTPFTYLIGWSLQNLWYYGVRYAAKCHPNDLWTKYFTSSSYVAEARQRYGEPDIIQIRKIFTSSKDAINWEIGVLRRMKLHERNNFLNKSCAGAIYYDSAIREKISLSAIGNKKTVGYTNEYRLQHGMKILTGKPKGTKHSEKAKKERSDKLKGKPVHPNLKYEGGYKHSTETLLRLSKIAFERTTYYCDDCHKSIKGKMNWDRHLLSKKHRSQLSCS
jgi:hypothetical protein